MKRFIFFLGILVSAFAEMAGPVPAAGQVAPKPLYRDPIFDGAADPSIIYDRAEKKWLMFYTNRRANVPGLTAVTWVHGTPIGIAESTDGVTWSYRGTVDFPKEIPNTAETPTFWAPAVVYDRGLYHMFVVVVPGIFTDWQHPRTIVHVTSGDLKRWKYEGTLPLVTDKVIDPCVLRLPDGTWRLWYNNERTGKTTYYADSADLYHWTDKGSAHLPRDRGEAPLVFFWQGHYWLLIDLLGNIGLGAYRSDDALTWERQPASLLDKPGAGKDDQNGGHHPEVILSGERAFLFYFVHPGVAADSNARDTKRSSIQVVELKYADGWLTCDRDQPTYLQLTPPANAVAGDASPAEPRTTREIDGVTYTFTAADEPIIAALVPHVAEIKQRMKAQGAQVPRTDAAPAPLTIPDLRLNRNDYLQRIARSIGLEKPLAVQEECYDGFVDNFERTEKLFVFLFEHMRTMTEIRAVDLMRKTELLRRLKAGEIISGFTLDPDGEHVNFDWKPPEFQGKDPRIGELFAQRDQRRIDFGYNYSADKDGVVNFSGYTKLNRPSAKPKLDAAPLADVSARPFEAAGFPPWPAVILPSQENLSPEEIAASIAKDLERISGLGAQLTLTGKQTQSPFILTQLIAHETAEIGIVDRYIGSRDRRWLCEGMANYTAWKIARDRAGAEAARSVYDLAAQLAQYAGLREKIDLRGWRAVENQRKEDADTPLTKAHYVFATRAIFLIAERHGEDFLPRWLQEIGKTARQKTDMRTVEKAYKKLAHEELASVLAAAVAPIPPAKNVPMTAVELPSSR